VALQQDIPALPDDMSWELWNCNMLHYFGEEPLPVVPEESWREFAASMSGLPTFSVYGISDGQGVADWRDWVRGIIGLVNGATE